MERDLLVPSWTRGAAFGAAETTPSRSSSGCQSGWTLYLDHSNGVRCLPCDPTAQRWMLLQADQQQEDSMASDASSGPRPRRLRDDEDPELDETRRAFEQPHPRAGLFGRHSYSSCSVHPSASGSAGSGCFASSTWSRGSQAGVNAAHVARRAAVVVHGAAARQQYREIIVVDDEDDDELDDTASSSAVFSSPVAMVHVNFSS